MAPIPLFDNPTTTSAFNPVTVSDPVTGDLLFYAVRQGVYTAAHQLMPGSPGMDPTTVRMACIPHPGAPHLYYLFKMTYSAGTYQVHYAVINTLLNGGLGEVTLPGYQLLATGLASTLVAVSSPLDGTHYLYLHELGSNVFLKFAISQLNGLDTQPVALPIGPSITHTTGQADPPVASPDGTKLAISNGFTLTTTFYQVDPLDGMLYGPVTIITGSLRGAAFSANSRYFYCTRTANQNEPQFFGYDLLPFNAASIQASEFCLDPANTPGANWFQLRSGADGEIYFLTGSSGIPSFSTSLGRITNADLGPNGATRDIGVVDLQRAHGGEIPWMFWFYDMESSMAEVAAYDITIHPNPADDHVVVSAPPGYWIRILDVTGRVIMDRPLGSYPSAHPIPVHHLPNGSFHVFVHADGSMLRSSQRLMIAH